MGYTTIEHEPREESGFGGGEFGNRSFRDAMLHPLIV
jgi:hypothetical protein